MPYTYAPFDMIRDRDVPIEPTYVIEDILSGLGASRAVLTPVARAVAQAATGPAVRTVGNSLPLKTKTTLLDYAKKDINAYSGTKGPLARGREAESRVLEDLGLLKNTQKVTTAEGSAIPDALTSTRSIEIKDCTSVACTRQIRIQTDAAKTTGRESVLITGEKESYHAENGKSI